MVNYIWGVLCQEILVDQKSNAVSYINCIEELGATTLPSRINFLKIGVCVWVDPLEVFRLKISVNTPDNVVKDIVETEDYKFSTKRNRINFALDNLQFEKEGLYQFLVQYKVDNKWECVQAIPCEIKLVKKK